MSKVRVLQSDTTAMNSAFNGSDSLITILVLCCTIVVLLIAVIFFYVLWQLRRQRDQNAKTSLAQIVPETEMVQTEEPLQIVLEGDEILVMPQTEAEEQGQISPLRITHDNR